MDNNYVIDGEVARDKLAMDIKYRRIARSEIEEICSDPKVQAAFIGQSYADKRPRQEWNKDYLDRLSYAVVGESFNTDYLLYLDEVADFVSKASFRKKVVLGVTIVLVIICGVVVLCYILAGGKNG